VPHDGTQEPNTIAQVLENGYMLKDRVLREAQVAVVKKPE
jgi:molecular chaperone GrpE (heat shock protein)